MSFQQNTFPIDPRVSDPIGTHGRETESVEYAISLQYPEGEAGDLEEVREMVKKYPFGPDGQTPKVSD